MKIIPTSQKILIVLLMTGQASVLQAAEDAFEFFQEEAKVVTASRREQSIWDIPMAVDVVTAEEIKASGATNLWDVMRFRPGIDVLDMRSVDGRRGIVSVRGIPQEFVHNLQVLLDGRSVYEPISGGVHWDQLPVGLDDIDRIEIIRGPNATLYGSGAALGVINIITRKPQGPTKVAGKALGGSQGTVQTTGSLESAIKNFAYRAGYTFRQQNGFPAAGGGAANDFLHSNQANARAQWTLAPGSELGLFTGGSWENTGQITNQDIEVDMNEHFEMLKMSQKIGDHSTVEILSARNSVIQEQTPTYPSGTAQWSDLQYDEEILHRLNWWDNRMNTTYGVNYRNVQSESPQLFAGHPVRRAELWSGYLNQSIQLAPKLSLSGGVSWEASNIGAGGTRQNYQVASLWAPLADHAFRASYAVAHTVPTLYNTAANNQLSATYYASGNPDLKPQKITSYEIGHRGMAMDKHLQMDTSLYYVVIDDIDTSVLSFTFFPQFLVTSTVVNNNQAIARGVETEFKYRFDRGHSVYANYTYEHVSDWINDQGSITRNTPAHKVNLGGIADMGHGFSGSLNVGYKDNYYITSIGRAVSTTVPSYWRVDARLAYAVNSHVELFVAGQNLAANTHLEFPDGVRVPRTYQGGVSVKFGTSS